MQHRGMEKSAWGLEKLYFKSFFLALHRGAHDAKPVLMFHSLLLYVFSYVYYILQFYLIT